MLALLTILHAGGLIGRSIAADSGSTDRAELIAGVREVAVPGSPGLLAVYAKSAGVVVTGKADGGIEVPVVAYGQLGRGRVVAFAHDGYLNEDQLKVGDTASLLGNAMKWAAGGKARPRIGLINGEGLRPTFEARGAAVERLSLDDPFQGFDALVLVPARLTPQQGSRLRAYERSGGGLIVAATAWAWRGAGKRPMSEYHGNQLLAGSGVGWTDGLVETPGPKRFEVGEASPLVNAATALDAFAVGTISGQADASRALESIRHALSVLPHGDAAFRTAVRNALASRAVADRAVSKKTPARASDPVRRIAVGLDAALAEFSPAEEIAPSPSAAAFPGAVPVGASRGEHQVTIDTSVPGWHSLGLYAAPGDEVVVTLPRGTTGLNLAVQIGSHTDRLWHLKSWQRSPSVIRRFALSGPSVTAANAHGGLIYIDVTSKSPARTIKVGIKNAVQAPLYRLGETTRDAWHTARQHPAPWAEIAGEHLILTIPSSAVRKLDDPEKVMRLWDEIVAAQDAFVSQARRDRAERIVADVQISAGYMHSGYPIMIPDDDSVPLQLDEARLRREGAWGHLHEIGHNHQHPDWTFEGTGEVTNNLIVVYIQDKLLGMPFAAGHDEIKSPATRARRIREAMAKGSPYSRWGDDPFLGLMMYIQVYEAFGPEPFRAAFAEYARLKDSERPTSDDEKRDQWLVRLSKATGKDLGPFFRAWGVSTSEAARASVSKLPAWMPEGLAVPRVP